MSDTIKLIVEVPKSALELLNTTGVDWLDAEHILSAVAKGIPLDDVKADIANLDRHKDKYSCVFNRPDLIDLVVDDVLQILDNIGKESEEV